MTPPLDRTADVFGVLWALASSPYIVAGLAMFGLSAATWLFVLSRTPVSLAYPFVGLGIVLTTLGGWALLGEPIAAMQLLAIAIIVLGITLLSLSG
jgi:multidrug transporter EmrE-like cation transporter